MKKLMISAVSLFAAFAAFAVNRIIDISESEKVQVYDEPGEYLWIAPSSLNGPVQLLVVGGGGGGGGKTGGGGGGGEVRYFSSVSLTAGNGYTVMVADGGFGAASNSGNNGGSSSISGTDLPVVTALGGGGGSGGWSIANGKDGANGGGAGGNGNAKSASGGSPTAEGGHKGGNRVAANYAAGGGGGMAEDGHLYNDAGTPGYGGAGVTNEITGVWKMYGYGGGACRRNNAAALSGARNEYGYGWNTADHTAMPGEEGTGGGGGGGGEANSSSVPGADGGSGTVIIRYTIDTARDDFSADITRSIKVPTMVTFTADLRTALSTMTWNFGDGSAEVPTTELSVSHLYPTAGVYTVTMRHGAQTIVKDKYVSIVSGTLYVDKNSANPTPPYDAPEKAAVGIIDAMSLAGDGFEVHVAPGDYTLPMSGSTLITMQFTNAVTLIGDGASPTNVVIRNPNSRRGYYVDRVVVMDNPNARLLNVTVADGYVGNNGSGGCVVISSNGGTVSNCVIRGGRANIASNAKCGGAYLSGGLITHTVFDNCAFMGSATSLGNTEIANAAILAGRAVVENCLIRNCGEGLGAVVSLQDNYAGLRNCTVVDCTAGFYTGNYSVTNASYGISCQAGSVKNCAAYNVKRVAFNDFAETYDAAFGADLTKFTSCVKAQKGDFKDYDRGNLVPSGFGALYNKGTAIADAEDVTDLAGKPRVQGRSIDIGCYEAPVVGISVIVR